MWLVHIGNLMNIDLIISKALELGIDPNGMDDISIIREIQIREGNEPCFKIKVVYCPYINCCWRNDCLHKHVFEVK